MPKNGVLTSFWNRLQDHDAARKAERIVSVERFQAAVLNDVERLLNERRPRSEDVPDVLRGTVLAYGLPDLTSFDLSSEAGAGMLALAIEETLRAFEPRLGKISVAAVRRDAEWVFRIRADLHTQPAVERVQFQAEVKPESSRVAVGPLDRIDSTT